MTDSPRKGIQEQLRGDDASVVGVGPEPVRHGEGIWRGYLNAVNQWGVKVKEVMGAGKWRTLHGEGVEREDGLFDIR